ncbi:MAG TPA: multidrug ABC transporter ATP-binding protein [Planctomycetaceae bacterium]|nr:multidrug ABC transporter ATP-binding protein [Planctomycetaceae bacterium]
MELSIRDLSKTYANGVRALDRVTLTIPKGMFGLLGPNGAGKSTLMRTIATLQEADSGSVRLGDVDVLRDKQQVRRLLGYLPQEFGVYPKVSAWALLDHLALLKGIDRRRERHELVDALLQRVNLLEHRRKAISGFSGGMKQRFGIAQALLGDPRLLIVDEPTAGLDPGERNRFYNLLSEVGENVIVILSTHIVQDVKELCSQMAVIHGGQVRYAGSPADAEGERAGAIWSKSIAKDQLESHRERYRILSTKLIAGRPQIRVFATTSPGDGFTAAEPDLEDVFFSKIADAPREAGTHAA